MTYKRKDDLNPDSVLKDFWKNNERFADLFNQVFFDGEALIKPGLLSEKDTDQSMAYMKKQKTASISRSRDVIKQYEDGPDLVLIGIENQTNTHYAMPVKSMMYDALSYTWQCKEIEQVNRAAKTLKGAGEFLSGIRKEDRIRPVVNLVLYYNEEPWDGPQTLSGMMEIPVHFQPFMNDYGLHILQVKDAAGMEFENEDNRDFFMILSEFYNQKGNLDMEHFREAYQEKKVHWETAAAISVAAGSAELLQLANENKGGMINMCRALENLKQEGRQEGEGIKEIKLIMAKFQKNLADAIAAEHLELDAGYVREIYRILNENPGITAEDVYTRLHIA